jgi:D-alanyl-D-alanine carboxypeptidase
MPYKVPKAEAVAHAKEPQFEVTSAIVVDAGSNEIVFAEKVKEPLAPRGLVNSPSLAQPASRSE